jgi:hypothetical protein
MRIFVYEMWRVKYTGAMWMTWMMIHVVTDEKGVWFSKFDIYIL